MAETTPPDELTLQQIADELGVHYMTVYRYVRIGMLPARKQGRSWKVARADLEAMRREPPPVSRTDDTRWSDRLLRRLIAGDEAGAWKVLESALSGGSTPQDALVRIISPALRSVGEQWADGTIGVDEEHTASAISLRLLGRIGARFARRGISKGTVLMGTTEGELHGLPTAIASEFLRQEGYEVVDLGPMVPPDSFARAASQQTRLVAVGITATRSDQDRSLRESVDAVRGAADVPVFVGGSGIAGSEHAEALGADGWAASASDLARLVSEVA